MAYSEACEVARRLNAGERIKRYLPAMGNTGWFAIDSTSPIWHDMNDIELARIAVRRWELAPRRPRKFEMPAS
ncbi:hypothetical protein [Pseudomonas sp. B14(2017)]|uniref:hypothetical protein n=1 Tax=Pseudomonas sp. B14(2017) TaxID=1981745 RepID=UPI001179E675|nr:hypothetical protein [Pseudomonas sp. B14(2017)]